MFRTGISLTWNLDLARKNEADVHELCKKRGISRSQLVRDLLERELDAARKNGEIGGTD